MKYVVFESIVPAMENRPVQNLEQKVFDEDDLIGALDFFVKRVNAYSIRMSAPHIEHLECMDTSQQHMIFGAYHYMQDAGETWELQLDFVADSDERLKV